MALPVGPLPAGGGRGGARGARRARARGGGGEVAAGGGGEALVGRRLRKRFEGHGEFEGVVQRVVRARARGRGQAEPPPIFHVVYPADGDEEDLAMDELLPLLLPGGSQPQPQPEAQPKPQPKPKPASAPAPEPEPEPEPEPAPATSLRGGKRKAPEKEAAATGGAGAFAGAEIWEKLKGLRSLVEEGLLTEAIYDAAAAKLVNKLIDVE